MISNVRIGEGVIRLLGQLRCNERRRRRRRNLILREHAVSTLPPKQSLPPKGVLVTDLGRKLNEIARFSIKLPATALIIVCKRCSELVGTSGETS